MDGKLTHWNATAPEVYCCCKRFQLCDGKHTEETLATAEVVVPYGSIVFLSSCVKNVNLYLLSIQHHLLPVTVSFGGLIVFNKLWGKKKKKAAWVTSCSHLGHPFFQQTARLNICKFPLLWCKLLTSSYMNWSVRADFPTPPLPTIITLWSAREFCPFGLAAAMAPLTQRSGCKREKFEGEPEVVGMYGQEDSSWNKGGNRLFLGRKKKKDILFIISEAIAIAESQCHKKQGETQ